MIDSSEDYVVRIAELEIDPARVDEYTLLLREEIEASVVTEPGVMFLHAMAIKDAPHKIRLLECYASRAAYEAHLQTPHFLKYKTQTATMVRALTLTDVDPVMLAAKPLS